MRKAKLTATVKAEAMQHLHRLAATHVKAFGADKAGVLALHDAAFTIPFITSIDIAYYWGICLLASEVK